MKKERRECLRSFCLALFCFNAHYLDRICGEGVVEFGRCPLKSRIHWDDIARVIDGVGCSGRPCAEGDDGSDWIDGFCSVDCDLKRLPSGVCIYQLDVEFARR